MARSPLRVRAAGAIADERLQRAIARSTDRLALGREIAKGGVNWEEMREAARAIRADILARLPDLLGQLADEVEARGGHVFFAADAQEANDYVVSVAEGQGAKVAVKSKSMVTEEIHLNDALAAAGIEAVETDMGEWIVQLAGETPSHIIAPALHRDRSEVQEIFNRVAGGDVSDVPEDLTAFARDRLRQRFLEADIGVSGVNFGVASTGTVCLVTNEGNGRMVTSLPKTHVAVMGMERVVADWRQLDLFLALLTRAATGQPISVYMTAVTGPRRPPEVDGPDELHLVVLDNGRSDILGGPFQEILHCIRCGACLNVCPVYRQIGGHGYGSTYSGPIGAVLSPLLDGEHEELSQASSLCAACHEVCPVKIPIQDLLLGLRREREPGVTERAAWRAWATAWSSPTAYRASTRLGTVASRLLPEVIAPRGWTEGRSLPRPRRASSFRERFERGEI